MKREVYESQKAFAGEKRPSMQRRCVGHDYTERQMYMLTMVTEGRRPLFGCVVGRSDAEAGSAEAPHVELSELGRRVEAEWLGIPHYYPQIEVIALQMMPDHLHGILFVRERMPADLSRVVRGFKTGCNRHFRALFPSAQPIANQVQSVANQVQPAANQVQPAATQVQSAATQVQSVATQVQSVATQSQQTKPQQTTPQQTTPQQPPPPQTPQPSLQHPSPREDRSHGLLFARGFNDKLLLREGQLQRWLDYLRDNPRRLLLKREHPDLFRVQRGLTAGGVSFSAIGNRFLLERPVRLQVQCSRRLTEVEIAERTEWFLHQARLGAVLVSPCISPGEKAIMRAAFNEGLPLIVLQENGFTDLAKPGGQRMEACASGQLLLLAPWQHHNERTAIRRVQCLELNEMARRICEND